MTNDRQRWNERYEKSSAPPSISIPAALIEFGHLLPHAGRALDLAGGTGDAAIHFAERGLDSFIADVSDAALRIADGRARDAGVSINLIQVDLTSEPVPLGPWDLITCFHYLDRQMLRTLTAELDPTGIALIAIATAKNLERHERPSARFLLEAGELPSLFEGSNVVDYIEGWTDRDTHEARIAVRAAN